mgnify:FL=1
MAGEEEAPVHCNTQQKAGNTGTVDNKRKKKPNNALHAPALRGRLFSFRQISLLIICSNAEVQIRTLFLAATVALLILFLIVSGLTHA